jgi:hypothetical protein
MQPEHRHPSRLAIVFVVVGLALSAIGIGYMVHLGRPRSLPPVAVAEGEPRAAEPSALYRELNALYRMLLHAFLLFLAFLLGSYLMVRIGRRVLHRQALRERTEYVDAWASYRLTQDEIDTATAELDDDLPPEAPPGDGEREPPDVKP